MVAQVFVAGSVTLYVMMWRSEVEVKSASIALRQALSAEDRRSARQSQAEQLQRSASRSASVSAPVDPTASSADRFLSALAASHKSE